LVVFAGALAVGGPPPALGDEVHLVNGDRLTGEIVTMEDGVLTLKTDYGGEIKIDWSKIQSLSSDTPLLVQMPGEPATFVKDFFYGGRVMVTTRKLDAQGPIPLADVQAINVRPISLRGTITLGGNNTQGNSDTKAINGAARFTIQAYRQRLFAEGKYNYGQAGSTVTARNSMGSFKYDYFMTTKIFLNASVLLEQDTLQTLDLRVTLGAGVGYQLLQTNRTTLSAVVGLAYVNTHFTTEPRIQTPSNRWSIRWEHIIAPERVTLFHKQDGFYDLSSGNALRINADQGVRISLYKNLFFNLEYDLRLNTQPAPGRKQVDQAFIFGVGYELR
jgi:putative salt-induced outer membrane protein YdiY